LVRSKEQADKIQSLGATPVMFNGLDDTEQIVDISKSYDGER
jgi:hydroxyethylthiazole kinase-like sugar kinase family protein